MANNQTFVYRRLEDIQRRATLADDLSSVYTLWSKNVSFCIVLLHFVKTSTCFCITWWPTIHEHPTYVGKLATAAIYTAATLTWKNMSVGMTFASGVRHVKMFSRTDFLVSLYKTGLRTNLLLQLQQVASFNINTLLGLPDILYFMGAPVFQPHLPPPGTKPLWRRNLPHFIRTIPLWRPCNLYA